VFGKLIMNTYTRMIFSIILFLVGLQWVGDPIDLRQTGDQTPAAGWHAADSNGPDNSHHYGLTSQDPLAIEPIGTPLAGPTLSEWFRPSCASAEPQESTPPCRIPRAPPVI
jgi:hypothetical protein